MLVPDPNCGGRGWIPVYDPGRVNPDGSPVMIGRRADPRCKGTGMIMGYNIKSTFLRPGAPAFPSTQRFVDSQAGYTDDNPAPKPDVVV